MRFIAALISATLIIATAPGAAPAASDPLPIDAILSLTGSGSFVGMAESRALGILETTVNGTGGIGGRPIKFQIADDQSSAPVAVQLGSALIGRGAAVIIGPTLAGPCEALAPLVKGKAVEFCLSSGFHPARNSYGFTAGVSTLEQLVFAVRYLRLSGLTKIATLTTPDVNGQDADRGVQAALGRPENRDVVLTASAHFNLTDLAVDAQIAHIKSSGAQALINYNTGTPFGTVLHGYTDVGLDIPLVTQPAALNYAVMEQYAAFLPKQLLITGLVGDVPAVAPRGAVQTALANYSAAFHAADVTPDHTTALAWDPALVIVAGLRKLGPAATGPALNAYIQNLHGWSGINGEYDFRSNQGGLTSNSLVMVVWNAAKKTFVPASRPGGAPLAAAPLRLGARTERVRADDLCRVEAVID
jgi:ABC-type branched-subunit amino acid transport system substrate-binding protein